MAKHTRVPEIVDALIALVGADPEVEPVAVVDGARTVNDYRDYLIFIGYRPDSDQYITVDRSAPKGLRGNDEETVNVGWLIAAKDAGDDMKIARDRAAAKLAVLERIVTEDMRLGLGAGVSAVMGSSIAWLTLHTDMGAECNIAGDITVKVLL